MKFNYAPSVKTADRLIKRFGLEFTLISDSDSETYDPVTDEYISLPNTETGFGALFDYETDEIDGTMIVIGDKRLLMSAVNMEKPKINQTVIFDDVKAKVQEPIKELKVADTPVYYRCNLRK